jgi:hypothetical protein
VQEAYTSKQSSTVKRRRVRYARFYYNRRPSRNLDSSDLTSPKTSDEEEEESGTDNEEQGEAENYLREHSRLIEAGKRFKPYGSLDISATESLRIRTYLRPEALIRLKTEEIGDVPVNYF